jgi:hypothetical protein
LFLRVFRNLEMMEAVVWDVLSLYVCCYCKKSKDNFKILTRSLPDSTPSSTLHKRST